MSFLLRHPLRDEARRRSGAGVAVALAFFAATAPSAIAEEETAGAFFRNERARQTQQSAPRPEVVQRPTHLIRHSAPVRGFARVRPTEIRPEAPATPSPEIAKPVEPPATAPDDVAAPAPENVPPASTPPAVADGEPPPIGEAAPAPALPAAIPPPPAPVVAVKPSDPTFFVLVLGDSLGQQLGQGLTEAFADQPDVSILRKARENTGLVRDDYFDWVKGARDILAASGKVNIAVMMLGSNDRQALREGANSFDLRQPRWREIYGDRVEAISAMFREKKIPLVWVGLPVMKSDRFSTDMAFLNEIYQDRAGKAGADFVDIWEAFLDDRGQYANYGPDVNGLFQKLRAGDGVHFTKPGGRKLAHFVEGEIRHAIEDARPVLDPLAVAAPLPPVAAPAPAPVTPPSDAKVVARAPAIVVLPEPAAPVEVKIPVKPAFGRVTSLTGPAISDGGELATPRRRADGGGSPDAVDRVLVQGLASPSRPGRADDFSWPRN